LHKSRDTKIVVIVSNRMVSQQRSR